MQINYLYKTETTKLGKIEDIPVDINDTQHLFNIMVVCNI